MKPVVLDSSALIAELIGEPGAEQVRDAMEDAAISAVNLSEVVAFLARRGGSREAILALLERLVIEIVPFDAEQALDSGILVTITREAGLSFGDRACLALAGRRGARVLTADRTWARISPTVGVEIILIR
jgi:ribonuclease VapC